MTRPERKGKLLALLLAGSFLCPGTVMAGGVPTIDASALAQMKDQVSTLRNQVSELTEMKSLMNQTLQTFGSFGSLGNLFGAGGSSMGSKSDFYENLKKFSFDPCAINLCQVGDNPAGTTDIEEARSWAMRNLYSSRVLDANEKSDLSEVRRRSVVYAATGGLALSTIVHNDLAGAGSEAEALQKIVESSTDLRGDIRANSAITLAAYEVQIKQLAMLTALLEVESALAINSTDMVHEEGGEQFPDAYIESDFSDRLGRERMTVTAPKKGTAGGSGLGGSLMGALLGDASTPLNDMIASSGLSNALGVLTSDNPVQALADKMAVGALPSLDLDTLSLGTVLSDATGLTSSIARATDGIEGALGPLSSIQTGLARNDPSGKTKALLGLAQGIAGTSGNDRLALTLDTGLKALSSNRTGNIVDFARGVMDDVSRNGANPSYLSYLQQQIDKVASGQADGSTLVLDASAMAAALGDDSSSRAAEILQIDAGTASDTDFRDMLAEYVDALASASGKAELHDLSGGIRKLRQEDVDALRNRLRAAQADTGTQDSGSVLR